jgi:hypothetical protein
MEISFAKRYRMYEKSTIATDYNNLLGDKPKTIINQIPSSATTNNNNNNNKENKYSTQFNLTSPRASAYNNNSNRTLSTYNNRPLTTALIYKQTNNLLDKSESITKKYNANYNSKSYGLSNNNNNNKTNLYYSSPVNSDFFENIRLNEFKFYNKTYGSNSQLRSTSAYVPQPPAPLPSYSQLLNSNNNNNTNNKLPNNIKLKQQILNQYYKNNTPVISSLERSKTNTNLTPTNTTPTTYIPNMINNKLASYLKKSKLTNDEINKYLAYKKKSVIFNDINHHHHHQELETNNNKRAMSHKINNNLNNSYNSFNNNTTNSIIIETNTRLNTAQNRSNIVNNKPNRSAIPISASFNNNNLKKKFNQLNNNNSSRPMSSNLNQSKSIINSNKQSHPVVKSNNSFKYFDEKFLKQKSSANQQKINNNKSTVNIKNNNDRKFTASRTTTAAGISSNFFSFSCLLFGLKSFIERTISFINLT